MITVLMECGECGEPYTADLDTERNTAFPEVGVTYHAAVAQVYRSCSCSDKDAGDYAENILATWADRPRGHE